MKCIICDRDGAAKVLGVCLSCIRVRPEEAEPFVITAHMPFKEAPPTPAEGAQALRSRGPWK